MNKLLSLLERLREKPKEVRVQVSFLTALSVTGVVGLLWGVTLPTRLHGLTQTDEVAQAETGSELNSFFANTRNNLGQLIGAGGEPAEDDEDTAADNTLPASDAYRVGAPPEEPRGYYDDPFETPPPGATPVSGKEVRIGTTTSKTNER